MLNLLAEKPGCSLNGYLSRVFRLRPSNSIPPQANSVITPGIHIHQRTEPSATSPPVTGSDGWASGVAMGDGSGVGVAGGGAGVSVGRAGFGVGGTGVSAGGTGVSVGGTGVSAGGTGVSVGGTGVGVGGTGVSVGGPGSTVGVAVAH